MTALASHSVTTPLDRALLRAAGALDRFVAGRVARRAVGATTAVAYEDARADAQALGGLGVLPR